MSVTKPAAGFWPTYPIACARSRGGVVHDADAVEQHVAVERAAGEARHQPGDDAEQRGLADPGRAGDQHQLALVDDQVDVGEDRRVVVRERDPAELDHAATADRAAGGEQSAPSRATAPPASAAPLSIGNASSGG